MVGLASPPPGAPPPPTVSAIENRTIGSIPVRVYRSSLQPQPTLVFFHGGGWVGGDLETHHVLTSVLALDCQCTVVAVDYRRPPEAPFPAAWDDALAVVRYVDAHRTEFGGLSELAVGGDSAGANLAASVALACRAEGPTLAAQFLLYPATDLAGGYANATFNALYPSRSECGTGYFVTLELMRWSASHTLAGADGLDPRASPLRAKTLEGLPPTVLCTAQFDPCRDEGLAYGAALRRGGVKVLEHHGTGLIHAYFALEGASAAASAEANAARASLRSLLSQSL